MKRHIKLVSGKKGPEVPAGGDTRYYRHPAKVPPWRPAMVTAGIYAVVSVVWILASDRIAAAIATSSRDLSWLQNIKGLAFVLATSVLIAWVVYRYARRADAVWMHLARSEDYFRRLYHRAPTAYQSLDDAGRIVEINEAWGEMMGCTRAEAVGRWMGDFLEPDEVETFREFWPRLIGVDGVVSREFRFRRRDGVPVVVNLETRAGRDLYGRFQQVHCILHNITERRKMEEELRESEAKFAAFMRFLPGYAYLKDREGRHLFVNQALSELFELPREAWYGKTLEEILPEMDHQTVRQTDERVFAENKPVVVEETLLVKGRESTYLSTKFPIFLGGRAAMLGGVSLDITERRMLEEQLRQAQKMEAIGQLAGGVAHDFNNLLQVINGYADMAMEDLPAEHPARVAVNEIYGSGRRAAGLINQLLAFSRRQVLNPVQLDLNEVVGSLLKMMKRTLGEHIRIDFLPGHRVGRIFADRARLEQVLINLCVNARDAMPEGGVLTLETENVRFDREYCDTHSWAVPGRFLLLSVTDTGSGMDAETMEHIWEPFFTTKEVGRGTGLGLSTVYGVVRQHNGMIQVYSELGKGTTFKVYLPIIERSAATIGTKVEAQPQGGSELLLVAEDDAKVRDLMRLLLEKAGYTVWTVPNGEEALALCEKNGDQIHLAILDVVMPGLGGRNVYEKLKAKFPRMRFLFSSGYSMNGAHTDFVLNHGFELLQKPFESKALLAKVRQILDSEAPPAA